MTRKVLGFRMVVAGYLARCGPLELQLRAQEFTDAWRDYAPTAPGGAIDEAADIVAEWARIATS